MIKDVNILYYSKFSADKREELTNHLHSLDSKDILQLIKGATMFINTISKVLAEKKETEKKLMTKGQKIVKHHEIFHIHCKYGKEWLFNFHEILKEFKLLNITFDKFMPRFTFDPFEENSVLLKDGEIPWLTATNELAEIFGELDGTAFALLYKKHVQLSKHFLDKKGKLMDSGVLKSSLEKKVRDEKRKEVIRIVLERINRLTVDNK